MLLAFETSCDETSVAVAHHGRVLANVVSSQVRLHAEYGGVVPELAAREHLRSSLPVARAALRQAGVTPLARYAGAAAAGVHPDYMGIGPVPAMNRALGRAGWQLDEVDLLEVNEAFAAQSVAVVDELKADPDRVNVNGGAIAIGHPLGCSGARIVTTLLYEMRRRGAARGAASMCIGVGQGIASLWEAA